VVLGTVAAVFIVWMLRRHGGQKLFGWALALILGGALGNVVDRLLHGYVVDFIQVHWRGWYFPSFNVADSAITVGAGLLILDELLRVRRAGGATKRVRGAPTDGSVAARPHALLDGSSFAVVGSAMTTTRRQTA
jgi:lipoprotein signal peptidase